MTVTEPSTVGALLRARRLELGSSLDEVAARTRVRRAYLAALEGDRFDQIPGDAYVAGFLRVYAEDLGLPVAPLLVRCREQIMSDDAGREKTASRSNSRPRGSRRRLSGWSVLLASATLVGAALLLAHFNAGGTRRADFFARHSAPDGHPAVLWAVLMPEVESEALALPLVSTPPGRSSSPESENAIPALAPSPPAVPGAEPKTPGRPRQAESRPVGVFLGWTADCPEAFPAVSAGPQMLVLNRAGAEGGGGEMDRQ